MECDSKVKGKKMKRILRTHPASVWGRSYVSSIGRPEIAYCLWTRLPMMFGFGAVTTHSTATNFYAVGTNR